ncbi:MAG: hypothetical protein R3C53_03970 [Pirellulaceae bacterium]
MTDRRYVKEQKNHLIDTRDGTSQWENCPAGSLGGYAHRARAHQLKRQALAIGGAMVGLGIIVAACYLPVLMSGSGESAISVPGGAYPRYGGLACKEVVLDLEIYFTTLEDEERRGRIKQHLVDCPMCRRKYQQRADELGVSIASLPPIEVHDNLVKSERIVGICSTTPLAISRVGCVHIP